MSKPLFSVCEAAFSAAVEAAQPGPGVTRALAEMEPPSTGVVVAAMGKAACQMASAAETAWGTSITSGVVVTKDGHVSHREILTSPKWRLLEAAHPVPDARCVTAATAVLEAARACTPDNLFLVLLSGGASALMSMPCDGLELPHIQEVTRLLLGAGAPITDLMCVRSHLLAVSSGQLALAACGGGGSGSSAKVVCLVLSDVVGDDVAVVASGMCSPSRYTFHDAETVLKTYALSDRVPPAVAARIAAGVAGSIPPLPATLPPAVVTRLVCSNRAAVAAAASTLR